MPLVANEFFPDRVSRFCHLQKRDLKMACLERNCGLKGAKGFL